MLKKYIIVYFFLNYSFVSRFKKPFPKLLLHCYILQTWLRMKIGFYFPKPAHYLIIANLYFFPQIVVIP